jgi:hypothetical protein
LATLEGRKKQPASRSIRLPKPWLPSRDAAIAAALGLAAAVVRLPFLARFPEATADEGLWTNSTKNFAMFGDWFMDGRTHVFLSPLFHALCYPLFELLGPSLAAARVVSASLRRSSSVSVSG